MDNSLSPRFVGIDLHKHFAVVAAVNAQQRLVLPPTRRIDLDEFPAWAPTHLYPTDVVVLEATSNAWWLYDLIAPLVQRVVIANALQVKWIAHAAVKTDKHDAVRLAKLLAANLIPEVWVPPLTSANSVPSSPIVAPWSNSAPPSRTASTAFSIAITLTRPLATSLPTTTAIGGSPSTFHLPNGCAPTRTSLPSTTSNISWPTWTPNSPASAPSRPGTSSCRS